MEISKGNSLMNIFLILFVPCVISFVFLIFLTHGERAWHRYKNWSKERQWVAEHYLIQTIHPGIQRISFDASKNWTLFIDGVATKPSHAIVEGLDGTLSAKEYKQFRQIAGGTQKGQYIMRSIDGGKNWAFFDVKTGELIGNCPDVKDEDLQQAWGFHKLSKYVDENGPIHLSDSNGLDILKDAGIEVKSKGAM